MLFLMFTFYSYFTEENGIQYRCYFYRCIKPKRRHRMDAIFDREAFLTALRRCFDASGLNEYLKDGKEEQYAFLCERLFSENKRYNLTAIKDAPRAAYLHFCDSVALAPLIPENARLLDVGCGGGFPSLPLAIARPDLTITAMDATEKKVVYVNESARLLRLSNVVAVSARAEEAATGKMRESFDVVTARAVAALPVLSELCLPFVRVGGTFFAMKGTGAEEETNAARRAFSLLGGDLVSVTPLTVLGGEETQSRFAVTVRKVEKTPDGYPRHFSKISKKPL